MKNLYEISYTKEYSGDDFDPYTTGLIEYQIVATGEWNACARLGQIYFDDQWTIDIVKITLVKRDV